MSFVIILYILSTQEEAQTVPGPPEPPNHVLLELWAAPFIVIHNIHTVGLFSVTLAGLEERNENVNEVRYGRLVFVSMALWLSLTSRRKTF